MNLPKQKHLYCSHCGAQNWEESIFCHACGHPIVKPPNFPIPNRSEETKKIPSLGFKKSKWFLILPGIGLIGVILIFFLFQFLFPLNPFRSLVGKWNYVSTNNGYDAFQENIEFYPDGTCYIPSPFLSARTLQYSFPKPGRVRMSANNFSFEYDFTLNGDHLRIYFEDGGYNNYVRVGASQSGAPMGELTFDVITLENLDQLQPIPVYRPGFLGLGKQKAPINIFGKVTWSPDSEKIFIPHYKSVLDFSGKDLIIQDFMDNKKSHYNGIFPDGNKFILGYEIHDQTGQTLLKFSGKPILISPDSRFLVTFDDTEKRTLVWDLQTDQQVIDIQNTQFVTTEFLAFSKDGLIAAVAIFQHGTDPDHLRIELWDTKTWKATHQIPFDLVMGSGESCGWYRQNYIGAAQFTRDDQQLGVWLVNTCEQFSQFFLTSIPSGTHLQTFTLDTAAYLGLKKMEFSADGKLLFAYNDAQPEQIKIYDLYNKEWLAPLMIGRRECPFMGFSPDGRFLISNCQLLGVPK